MMIKRNVTFTSLAPFAASEILISLLIGPFTLVSFLDPFLLVDSSIGRFSLQIDLLNIHVSLCGQYHMLLPGCEVGLL